MKKFLLSTLLLFSSLISAGPIVILDVKDAITPGVQDYILRGLEKAKATDATAVIIQLDTPGGLDLAMREIIQAMIDSPIPVITYVSPNGARAASAGTYIMYASHVAAMAPATNLGSATPVKVSGGILPDAAEEDKALHNKITNDAVAYIEGLAKLRNRNIDWAKKAVTNAANINAEVALKLKVIDMVAKDLGSLIAQLDGVTIKMAQGDVTLKTQGKLIQRVEWDWRSKLLAIITNPTVAYILLLIGIYGIIFELANPGMALPGVVGAICLLMALYAFQLLSVSYAGLGLLFLGILLMVAEIFVSSFGVLGIGGLIAFIAGSIFLFDPNLGFQIPLSLIITMAVVNGVILFLVITMAVRSHQRKVVSGVENMIGKEAMVLHDFTGKGKVKFEGEIWNAECASTLTEGQIVIVESIDGLTVKVREP